MQITITADQITAAIAQRRRNLDENPIPDDPDLDADVTYAVRNTGSAQSSNEKLVLVWADGSNKVRIWAAVYEHGQGPAAPGIWDSKPVYEHDVTITAPSDDAVVFTALECLRVAREKRTYDEAMESNTPIDSMPTIVPPAVHSSLITGDQERYCGRCGRHLTARHWPGIHPHLWTCDSCRYGIDAS